MSRIGKNPIIIPQGVEVKIEGLEVLVRGPKGELSRTIRPEIKTEMKEGKIFVSADEGSGNLWGLTRTLIFNMVKGVVDGFEKRLEIHGIGFKAEVSGEEIILNVGFSNPVKIKIPADLKVATEKNIIIVSGINKESVGQFAAIVRKAKPPEPYKGKGIRYLGEQVRRKAGKKAATTAT